MVVISRMNQSHWWVLFVYMNLIAFKQAKIDLPIARKLRTVPIAFDHDDSDLAVTIDHNGPVTQGVRTDRYQRQRIQCRMQNRATS